MDNKYRIDKFKLNKEGKVRVEYRTAKGADEWDDHLLGTKDQPAPALIKKVDEFKEYVNDICELNMNKLEEEYNTKLKIAGFSFSYAGEKDIMGCTITAVKSLSNSNAPLVLNTPHKIEDFYADEGDANQLMPGEMVNTIYELFAEITDFIDGERAQLSFKLKSGEQVTVEVNSNR